MTWVSVLNQWVCLVLQNQDVQPGKGKHKEVTWFLATALQFKQAFDLEMTDQLRATAADTTKQK